MRNVVGICNFHDGPHLGELTANRPLGTVTLLGRYALMDVALSNFSNSGIDRVALLVENNVQSIRTHVGSGNIYVNNTVTGFQRFFSNEKLMNDKHFNTDVNNIIANQTQLEGLDADYVVVAPPFMLLSIDLNEVVENHIASGADVTIVYTKPKRADKDYLNCDELNIYDENKVMNIIPYTGANKTANISLEIFVYNRKAFEELIRSSRQVSELYNLRKMVAYAVNRNVIKANAFKFEGYVAPILSLEHYVRYSFELLDYNNRRKLFKDDWPIYTTTHNTPPALYGEHADVYNSFVANGSIIKGKVHNSIISREVVVEEGAVVENSILFTKSNVGKNVTVKYVLAEKSSHIVEKKKVEGSEDEIIFIPMGARI